MRYLSTLNGVIGDSLEKRKSALSIQMGLFSGGRPVTITKNSLRALPLLDNGKICLLAHGSCSFERDWHFKGSPEKDYGSLLQAERGHFPWYLRYNSGLHISTNGRLFSTLLENLVRSYPTKVSEIVLVGHSMGGLIFRSACHYGKKTKKKWIRRVKKIFYLGTPHLGTHFEKFGKLTTTILKQIPNFPTRAIAAFIDLRSAGIKDMRHGYILDEDWQKKNADDLFYIHRNRPLPLDGADHYLICGTISKCSNSRLGRMFGDGMVHPGSGTGQGLFESSAIPFPPEHCRIFAGISHFNLIRSPQVYEQIRDWC